jgi:hypothetical protein
VHSCLGCIRLPANFETFQNIIVRCRHISPPTSLYLSWRPFRFCAKKKKKKKSILGKSRGSPRYLHTWIRINLVSEAPSPCKYPPWTPAPPDIKVVAPLAHRPSSNPVPGSSSFVSLSVSLFPCLFSYLLFFMIARLRTCIFFCASLVQQTLFFSVAWPPRLEIRGREVCLRPTHKILQDPQHAHQTQLHQSIVGKLSNLITCSSFSPFPGANTPFGVGTRWCRPRCQRPTTGNAPIAAWRVRTWRLWPSSRPLQS